jgi:hypothetical protein
MSDALLDSPTRWLLIFAHPGHELRVHHVLERTRPAVVILTDGSGSTGASRASSTLELLARAGAVPAPVFCALRDQDAYGALMTRDAELFVNLCDRITELLLRTGTQAMVIDAAEGYNPVHDLCHWLGRAAAANARKVGNPVDVFELDLVSHPNGPGTGLRVPLDESAFARKLAAIDRYPALASEAAAAFAQFGRDAFRVEFLRRVNEETMPLPSVWVPYYEQVGEARVKTGLYSSVLRYADHVKPVVEALLKSSQPSVYAQALSPLHQ